MIVFFGPVGAGKSVQGQLLATRLNWDWVSTGNIFRASTDPEVQEILAKGQLISSEKTYEVLASALDSMDAAHVILDGFPRKKEQAEWLIANQATHGYKVDLVLVIDVSNEEIIKRLSARGRVDDDPKVIEDRLKIYHSEVEPILSFLEQQNVPIARVDGMGDVNDIHDRIAKVVVEHQIG